MPFSSPDSDSLQESGAECLATRLRRASDRQAARLRLHLQAVGLSTFEPGWWPLFLLIAEQESLTPGAAAQALRLSPAAVSQTAAALLRAGLLAAQDDPRDARVHHLRLTPAGLHLQPRLQQAAQAANRQLAAALGEDARHLRRVLDALDGVR